MGNGVSGSKMTTLETIGLITPLTIMTVGGLGYITFEIATLVRRSKYEKYYQKWEESKKRASSCKLESLLCLTLWMAAMAPFWRSRFSLVRLALAQRFRRVPRFY